MGLTSFDSLAAELIARFDSWSPGSGGEDGWDDALLDDLARRAFEVQFAGNVPYRRYCESRSVTRSDISGWRDLPPVPTAAFRAADLVVGDVDESLLVFRTSGTSRGTARRGQHFVRSPDLYRASADAGFRVYVSGGETTAKIVTLSPSFVYDPDSSLGWMLDHVRSTFGAKDGVSVTTPSGIDWYLLEELVAEARLSGRPLCLLGTTLSFSAWLERMVDARSSPTNLPAGSRVVDTGGLKGQSDRRREDVVSELAFRLGMSPSAIINEFGMTELLSQRYGVGIPVGPLRGPPWLRTRVLDPVTLAELPAGETGILCHYDLANLGSVCAVLTEDRGRTTGSGIEWRGRTEGAPPRGCSLATAELLEAQHRA
jgi:hypothetical protein